jgi:hypothetical protein
MVDISSSLNLYLAIACSIRQLNPGSVQGLGAYYFAVALLLHDIDHLLSML